MYTTNLYRILIVSLVLLILPNLSCIDPHTCADRSPILYLPEAVGEQFTRSESGIWREDQTVHPGSQPEMHLYIESDDTVRLVYERDGQLIEEIYEVEARRKRTESF